MILVKYRPPLEGVCVKLPYIQYTPLFLREPTLTDIIQVVFCYSHIPTHTTKCPAKRPQRVTQTHYDARWCDGVEDETGTLRDSILIKIAIYRWYREEKVKE